MIRMIAFDLDGTLLNDEKQIMKENLEMLRIVGKKGIYLVPATGRLLTSIPEELLAHPGIRYLVLMNGAEVRDKLTQSVLYDAIIDYSLLNRVFDHLEQMDCFFDCFQQDFGRISEKDYQKIDQVIPDPFIIELLKTSRKPVPDLRNYLRESKRGVSKISVFLYDKEKKAKYIQKLQEIFPELSITSGLPYNIEINSKKANKGEAVLALAKNLGIKREEILAFGDGLNDISMLEMAGVGIAMENAMPLVKEKADFVTKKNTEAGVANGIQLFCEL